MTCEHLWHVMTQTGPLGFPLWSCKIFPANKNIFICKKKEASVWALSLQIVLHVIYFVLCQVQKTSRVIIYERGHFCKVTSHFRHRQY